MFKKLSVKDLALEGKKVLLRVDFNVPLSSTGEILDDSRIVASLPTIKYILDAGGAIILLSHMGRPKGRKDPKYSLAPCAKALANFLSIPVKLAPDSIGMEVEELVKNLKPKEILILENLRFHEAEEKPKLDPTFAQKLAAFGDCYIDDAFGTAHRAHSSTVSLPLLFPGKAAAGFLLEKEVRVLSQLLEQPKKPFVALIGGAKISTKIAVLRSLLQKIDLLLIGGGMAFTFLKAQGGEVGRSIVEDDFLNEANLILQEAQEKKIKVILPNDFIAVEEIKEGARSITIDIKDGIPGHFTGVDLGPKSLGIFISSLQTAGTILWNGPVGIFEINDFAKGTIEIARAIVETKAETVIGGGETLAAVKKAGVTEKISHISTGGGATLEFIEFGTLPGIEALTDRDQ